MKLFDKNEGELNDEFVTVTHSLTTSDSTRSNVYTGMHARLYAPRNLSRCSCFWKWICHPEIAERRKNAMRYTYTGQSLCNCLESYLDEREKNVQNWNRNVVGVTRIAQFSAAKIKYVSEGKKWLVCDGQSDCKCECSQLNISMGQKITAAAAVGDASHQKRWNVWHSVTVRLSAKEEEEEEDVGK